MATIPTTHTIVIQTVMPDLDDNGGEQLTLDIDRLVRVRFSPPDDNQAEDYTTLRSLIMRKQLLERTETIQRFCDYFAVSRCAISLVNILLNTLIAGDVVVTTVLFSLASKIEEDQHPLAVFLRFAEHLEGEGQGQVTNHQLHILYMFLARNMLFSPTAGVVRLETAWAREFIDHYNPRSYRYRIIFFVPNDDDSSDESDEDVCMED